MLVKASIAGAIVTNSSGIGLAAAKKFVEEGAYVFITGRRQSELDKAKVEIDKNVTTVQGDVANLDDLDRLYRTVKDTKMVAFEISDEHLRRLRQATKVDGYGAVLTRARGCAERDAIAPAKVRELRALFEEGWNPTEATRRQRRRGRVSRSTVSRERRRWQAEKAAAQGSIAAMARLSFGLNLKNYESE